LLPHSSRLLHHFLRSKPAETTQTSPGQQCVILWPPR
jgi:hypothetical protein